MELFVDFQGFKDANNTFVIKEFAISTIDGAVVQHWIVRSPCPFSMLDTKTKTQCNWVTNHYHGIKWQDGDITIQHLHRQVQPMMQDSVVYVKGQEKSEYIREFFRPSLVVDLEHYPSLKKLFTPPVCCFFHNKTNKICALNNVSKLVFYRNFYN